MCKEENLKLKEFKKRKKHVEKSKCENKIKIK